MHCVYRCFHTSGLFYIGKSQVKRILKGYKGSGVKLTRFWKTEEFGKDTWKIEILEQFDTAEAAYLRETEIISQNLEHPDCLNLAHGGIGGKGMMGKKHSEITKRKMSAVSKASFNQSHVKLQRSERMKDFWSDPENRKRRKESMNSVNAKTNRSESAKRQWITRKLEKV